jgi:hypothetical protein
MADYYPDKWMLVEIESPDNGKVTKVMASWYGGFAGSNSWKLSSGVTKITKEGKIYAFLNDSGSTYYCHEDAYGASMYTHSVYLGFEEQLKNAGAGSIRILDEDKVMEAVLVS